jgi:hypothetical protein
MSKLWSSPGFWVGACMRAALAVGSGAARARRACARGGRAAAARAVACGRGAATPRGGAGRAAALGRAEPRLPAAARDHGHAVRPHQAPRHGKRADRARAAPPAAHHPTPTPNTPPSKLIK